MKKNIFIVFISLVSIVYGQIKVQNTPAVSILNENPFLDATIYGEYDNNIGKGLYFPTTDLTQWEFKTDLINRRNFSTYFNGMIVYNSVKGQTISDANKGGKRVNVEPGFYYFKNPNQTFPSGSVANGEWVRIANADDIAKIASGENIYNVDGTLDGNRTLNTAGHNLSFTGDGKVGIGALPNNTLDKAKLQVEGLIRSNTIRVAGNELSEKEVESAKEVFVDTNGIFRVKEADKAPKVGNNLCEKFPMLCNPTPDPIPFPKLPRIMPRCPIVIETIDIKQTIDIPSVGVPFGTTVPGVILGNRGPRDPEREYNPNNIFFPREQFGEGSRDSWNMDIMRYMSPDDFPRGTIGVLPPHRVSGTVHIPERLANFKRKVEVVVPNADIRDANVISKINSGEYRVDFKHFQLIPSEVQDAYRVIPILPDVCTKALYPPGNIPDECKGRGCKIYITGGY